MKIAYVNTFYAPDEIGGAEKSVRFLAESMVANGHSATVITQGRTRESSELNGVHIERVPTPNLYFPVDAGKQSSLRKLAWHTLDSYNPNAHSVVGKLLDKIQPDVIHTNNVGGFSVSVWRAAKERRIPLVHTLRDYYLLCPNTAMFKNGQPCTSRCTKCQLMGMPRAAASKLVDHVVGNSQFILDKHLNFGLFPNAQRSVIYNAYAPSSTTDCRAKDKVTFGFIGRIAPTKGVGVLIDAAKLLNQTDPNGAFQVLIAGDGDQEYVSQLKVRAAGAPIYFLGRVKPEDLYNRCDWTVLPSIWDEPLARVTFESFAHGVPVIGSQTGGTPELVAHNCTGKLYKAALDPSALATEMRAALQETQQYSALRVACMNLAQDFLPLRTFERYMTTYASVTAGER